VGGDDGAHIWHDIMRLDGDLGEVEQGVGRHAVSKGRAGVDLAGENPIWVGDIDGVGWARSRVTQKDFNLGIVDGTTQLKIAHQAAHGALCHASIGGGFSAQSIGGVEATQVTNRCVGHVDKGRDVGATTANPSVVATGLSTRFGVRATAEGEAQDTKSKMSHIYSPKKSTIDVGSPLQLVNQGLTSLCDAKYRSDSLRRLLKADAIGYPAAMSRFKRIAVYCASSDQIDPQYRRAATALGHLLAASNIGLVFGGGSVGLMGAVADAVIEGGGEVIGVIPEKLQALELGHPGCTEMHVVDTMHTRKLMMMEKADAFIAMPGGFGTLEELFEVVTWAQLNYHRKPISLFNVCGFYDALIQFIGQAVDQGFIREELRDLITVGNDAEAVLKALDGGSVPDLESWLRMP